MNEWQLLRQVQHLLRLAKWPTTNSLVFARESVLATARIEESALDQLRTPVALLFAGDAQADPEAGEVPDLLRFRFTARLVHQVAGDAFGQNVLMGANPQDLNKSAGKGLLEVAEKLLESIEFLNRENGVAVQSRFASAVSVAVRESLRYRAFRDYEFEAWVVSDRVYPAPVNLKATGNVSLTWKNPADRFDRFRLTLRRAAGATPPATPTSGTGVALGGNLVESATDGPLAPGTYSYSLFMGYDDYHPVLSAEQAFSTPATATIVIV